MKVKIGFDPTSAHLHLGHLVLFRRLRKMQDDGHTVIAIIGSYTAKIGDPSGKNQTRPMLTDSDIANNRETYRDAIHKFLDIDRTIILDNQEWLPQFMQHDFMCVASHFTVAQILERKDFSKRFSEHTPIGIHELLYPILQGYDSYHVGTDVEFGGVDQLFNLNAGRDVQRFYNKTPQTIETVPLLIGLDGVQKMSKSYGNAIGLTEEPYNIYAKTMSLPDRLLPHYYDLLMDEPLGSDPYEAKKRLAHSLTAQCYNVTEATMAQKEWMDKVSEKRVATCEAKLSSEIFPIKLSKFVKEIGLAESVKEAERKIKEGSVKIDDISIRWPEVEASISGKIVRVGKKSVKVVVLGTNNLITS